MRFLLAVADLARWPVERLWWPVERRLLWPLRERTAGRGISPRTAGAGALAAVAVAAGLAGILVVSGGDDGGERRATPARLAVAAEPAAAKAGEPQGPALRGVPPSFGVGKGVGVASQAGTGGDPADAPIATSGLSAEAAADGTAGEPGEAAAATASSAEPVPAGPAAMKAARRFAEAFVFYEVGEKPARARAVFAETATPGLAEALGERPPRQPAGTEVPKARVLNLVPGPRHGRDYTVSVSLLRVGLTSELRLELSKQDGTWLVTDVRG